MLKELYLEYSDGRVTTKLIHIKDGEQVKIYPQRDKITLSNCKTFKYRVDKHPYLSPCLINLGGKLYIMPHDIEVHPETTLNDIHVIQKRINKPTERKTWKFQSSSGNGEYVVTKTNDVLRCNCMGFFRSKGNCKHVKDVKSKLYV